MRITIRHFAAALFVALLLLSACLYPPTQKTPSVERTEVVIQLPYDLALDAVMHVIASHEYRIQANDPTHGVIEAQTVKFSVADADCGVVGTVLGKEAAEPTTDSSVVFTFHIKPDGPEASTVGVQAWFATPVRVPFHPPTNADCVSRGVQEQKLLKEIEQQAAVTHRPDYKAASAKATPTPTPTAPAKSTIAP